MASWSKKSSSWKTSKPGRKGMARKKRKNTRGKTKSARRRYGASTLVCPTTWHGLKVKKAKGGRCYVLREKGTTPRARFVKKVSATSKAADTWGENQGMSPKGGGYARTQRFSSSYERGSRMMEPSFLEGTRRKRKGLRGAKRSAKRSYRRR